MTLSVYQNFGILPLTECSFLAHDLRFARKTVEIGLIVAR